MLGNAKNPENVPPKKQDQTPLPSTAMIAAVLNDVRLLLGDFKANESTELKLIRACLVELVRVQADQIRALETSAFQQLALEPLFRDVCSGLLRVRASKRSLDAAKAAASQKEVVAALDVSIAELDSIEAHWVETISNHGIEEFSANEGAYFDAEFHKLCRGQTKESDTPWMSGRVAKTIQVGFRLGSRTLLKPVVILYQKKAESK